MNGSIECFIVNSDSTSIKEARSFSESLTATLTVQPFANEERHTDIVVPENTYFENITLINEYTNEIAPVPNMVYVEDVGENEGWELWTYLSKLSNTKYRLSIWVSNLSLSAITLQDITVTVKAHLFLTEP